MGSTENNMADTKSKQNVFSLKYLTNAIKDTFHRLRTHLFRFIEAVTSIISAFTTIFSVISAAVCSAYRRVAMLIFFILDCVRQVLHFDYKGYVMWMCTLPMKYYSKCKEETRKHLWLPFVNAIKRKVHRIARAFHARLREIVIYAKGFRELCRRLFLLASDYTPGGEVTVTALLVIVTVIFVLKILIVVRVLFQIAQLVYRIVAFLLHPLLLTMKDMLSIFDPLLQIIFTFLRVIVHAILLALKGVAIFIWLNVVSMGSGLHRCWRIFANSSIVKFVWNSTWSILGKIAYFLLENFVFVVLPFMTKASYYLAAVSLDLSSVAYRNFFVVTLKLEEKFEHFTATGIASFSLILWATLLTFRFRNRLSGTFTSEIDDKKYAITSSSSTADRSKNSSQRGRTSNSRSFATYDSSRRMTTNNSDSSLRLRGKGKDSEDGEHAPEDVNKGHIRYSSQVSICTSFITGTCQLGSKCENHHCPLPYHWQYRLSLEGWKSFSTEDNSKIEELFCDPKNDIVSSSEIELTVKTYSRERSGVSRTVKIDFENMKMEKSYHRVDLRRLSTESYVTGQSTNLSTPWLWYRKEESGEWTEYGITSESDAKQEDLECAFLRRDRDYSFTRDGQEFRLQFFVNPMIEKSFRPYSRKIVRRRPKFKSPEDIKQLIRGKTAEISLFSFRRLFWWR